ncbi:MAG: hypothetical protein IPN59_07635 [Holophaga sp.]|nr:hypothetical protein [Holophaga sp.]
MGGRWGEKAESVPNVEDARSYLAKRRPELILLDVIMLGVVVAYCRELGGSPHRDIPVVMLTDVKANAHDRSLEAGADDYRGRSASMMR